MAILTPIPTGTNLAFEDVGGVQFPGTKLKYGAAGAAVDVADATPLPVKITAGSEVHIGTVGGSSLIASTTITRPADILGYVGGDLVSFNTVAATVNATPTTISVARINGGTGSIFRAHLSTNKPGLTGSNSFRVHMLKQAPTAVNGDNGVFSINGIASKYIIGVDVTLNKIFSDGAKGFAEFSSVIFETLPGQQTIYVMLESIGVYTPISGEIFTISLEVIRD